MGRHVRGPDRPRQGALLRERRACRARCWRHDQHPDAAGPEPHRLRDDSGVEHVRPGGSSGHSEQYLGHSLAARDSPQPLQIQAENHTPSRHEAETDIDWTFVGNLSSVIGSSKVNTFRVSAVKEDVFFGNPNFNTNGHDQKILLPQLNFLSFQDQQSARANRRLDVAYGADDVFAWFVPGKGGDHDMKFGVNYLYSSLRTEDYGNLNGTFITHHRSAVRPRQPANLPGAAADSRPGRSELPDERALHRHVRAGQVAGAHRLRRSTSGRGTTSRSCRRRTRTIRCSRGIRTAIQRT